MRKVINGKYIDLNKLKDNIITIRYCSTGALIPTVKVQSISRDVRGIVEDIINDKFEKRLYEKFNKVVIFASFVQSCIELLIQIYKKLFK